MMMRPTGSIRLQGMAMSCFFHRADHLTSGTHIIEDVLDGEQVQGTSVTHSGAIEVIDDGSLRFLGTTQRLPYARTNIDVLWLIFILVFVGLWRAGRVTWCIRSRRMADFVHKTTTRMVQVHARFGVVLSVLTQTMPAFRPTIEWIGMP